MLHHTGALYQPQTELIWTLANADKQAPNYAYCLRAKEMLRDINACIAITPNHIGMRDGEQVWQLLLLANSAPQCACPTFAHAAVWSARSMDKRAGFWSCPHTIAWNAYAGILNDHWRALRRHAPAVISAREYWSGTMYKLDGLAIIDFARWLHKQPKSLIANSAAITQRNYLPARMN